MVQFRYYKSSKSGQSLVEIIVVMGLMALILPALITGIYASREGRAQKERRTEANYLLREAYEAVRVAREQGWGEIKTNGTYHPVSDGTTWSLDPGSELVGDYTRSIVISDTRRNNSGAIVGTGGNIDPSTKKIDILVSWSVPIPSSVTGTQYVSRFLENTVWAQTTQSDFDAGSTSNTQVTPSGEVMLSTTGGGGWDTPSIHGTYNTSGNRNGYSVFVSGNYAYLGNNSGPGSDFFIFNISNPASPALEGSLDLGISANSIYVSGNYAYVATSSSSGEFIVVDITDKTSPTVVNTTDLSGSQEATSIFVQGNYAYIGGKSSNSPSQYEFFVIDISNPLSPSISSSTNFSDDISSVYVSGNYAYLATSINSQEFVAVNITNPGSPSTSGSFDLPSNTNAESVFVSDDRAYVTTLNNNSGSEFYILDISSLSSISQIGSYEVGAAVNSLSISGDYAFLATALSNKHFIVLDISTETLPVEYSSLNLGGEGTDIKVFGSYAYLSTYNNSAELTVVKEGSSSNYETSGEFTSQTFDAGAEVGFNYVSFTFTEPSGTDINFQIALGNSDPPSSFVGPDGTSATFFGSGGGIALPNVSGRYFRAKAYLTGNGSATPVLQDFFVNYSP